MNNVIIVLTGKKQSGKDTTYKVIDSLVRDAHMRKFAARLYEYTNAVIANNAAGLGLMIKRDLERLNIEANVQNLVNLCLALNDQPQVWEHGKPRGHLQKIGTDIFRKKVSENYWVNLATHNLPNGVIVFTDGRFPNEVEAGDYIIKLVGGIEGDKHESETHTLPYDYIVDNSARDMGLLTDCVSAILHDIKKTSTKIKFK
jgi:hypothetical protein